jgi:aminoglycoside phosphotransferase (APT) family kinase protein
MIDARFHQLIQPFDPESSLVRAWPLKGGVSADVMAIEVEDPDGRRKRLLVRRHGPIDLRDNPNIAADEFRLLQLLQSAGLPVPQPHYLDESGEIFPTPYIVVEYIEGGTEFRPRALPDYLLQMATQLARIHALDGTNPDLSFLPDQQTRETKRLSRRPAQLDDSLNEEQIRDVLEAAWPLPRRNGTVLLHGDYWPGNIVWNAGRLAGVIDWEDAGLGDPLCDLGKSRLDVLWAFGMEAMVSFTQHYAALTTFDFTDLPYWDLCAALRPAGKVDDWAGDEITATTMRERHPLFVAQALEALSRR